MPNGVYIDVLAEFSERYGLRGGFYANMARGLGRATNVRRSSAQNALIAEAVRSYERGLISYELTRFQRTCAAQDAARVANAPTQYLQIGEVPTKRALVDAVAREGAAMLGVEPPARIDFFRTLTADEAQPLLAGPGEFLPNSGPLAWGQYRPSEPDRILISEDVEGDDLVNTVFHEVFHYANPSNRSEEDARAFAASAMEQRRVAQPSAAVYSAPVVDLMPRPSQRWVHVE